MPKLDEQIQTLEQKLKELKLRQQRTEARKRAIDSKRELRAAIAEKGIRGRAE